MKTIKKKQMMMNKDMTYEQEIWIYWWIQSHFYGRWLGLKSFASAPNFVQGGMNMTKDSLKTQKLMSGFQTFTICIQRYLRMGS